MIAPLCSSSFTPTRSFTPRSRTSSARRFTAGIRSSGCSIGGRRSGRRSGGEVDELIDVDESRVVTFHKVIATGRTSGIETVRELGGLIEIRDGRVVSQWIYLDRSEALQAAGLTG